MTDANLISRAIDASGVSLTAFARFLISRDKRTVSRWKAGGTIPPEAHAWLARWLDLTERERATIVRLLVPEDKRQEA